MLNKNGSKVLKGREPSPDGVVVHRAVAKDGLLQRGVYFERHGVYDPETKEFTPYDSQEFEEKYGYMVQRQDPAKSKRLPLKPEFLTWNPEVDNAEYRWVSRLEVEAGRVLVSWVPKRIR